MSDTPNLVERLREAVMWSELAGNPSVAALFTEAAAALTPSADAVKLVEELIYDAKVCERNPDKYTKAELESSRTALLQAMGREGWVSVPMEPTEEMLVAACPRGETLGDENEMIGWREQLAGEYRAMLAAIPGRE